MNCPSCGGRTHVTETRDAGDIVYRTRRCDPCEWTITSKEQYINGLMPKDAIKPREPAVCTHVCAGVALSGDAFSQHLLRNFLLRVKHLREGLKSEMTIALMLFVWLFAAFGPGVKSYIKALSGHAGRWLVAIGAAGWLVGALIQVARYGAITAPALQ